MATRRNALRSAAKNGRMVSQPMLVIPQPVLRSHECLDEHVRMARVEPNAYIALGIKEEPIDQDDDGFYVNYHQLDEEELADESGRSSTQQQSEQHNFEEEEEEESHVTMRTTRALQRKRLMGLQDDANNNSKKQPAKRKRAPRAKKTSLEPVEAPNDGFNPIVISTYSMAPTSGMHLHFKIIQNNFSIKHVLFF